ncbi:MAG: phospholipase D family protein [Pseudomonadota bacterium]
MQRKKSLRVKVGLPWLIMMLLIGFLFGNYFEQDSRYSFSTSQTAIDNANQIELCFTPPSGCGTLIAQEIARAKESIYVQAYGLTSGIIVNQLIQANNRGVKVQALLDKSNVSDKWSKMMDLVNANVSVRIDKVSGIAHNKVIIIDEQKVITGSFNFTNAADKRNAENVIIINNKSVAKEYLNNWQNRYNKNYAK